MPIKRETCTRPDYDEIKGAECMVYTIEVVVSDDDNISDFQESLRNGLDQLRCYAGAEIIGKKAISNKIDDAWRILDKRKIGAW